ncbi:MAG: hypothetical protein AAF990_16215 [Bacteroidota bacterium]
MKKQKTAGFTDLTDQVFAIIDSRIQYLEYENDRMLTGCFEKKPPEETAAIKPTTIERPKKKDAGRMINNFDSLLAHARNTGHSLKLLFFLRTHLLRENARVVLDLLTNNRYLKYNEEHLGFLLQVGRWN